MESFRGRKGWDKFPKTNGNIQPDKTTYTCTTNKPTEPQVITISKPTSNCCKFERKYSNSSGPPMSYGYFGTEKEMLKFLWRPQQRSIRWAVWSARQEERLRKINPLKPELNPICYLLALLGAHHFLHVSRIRVKLLTFGRLSYIYGAPILDVSRSHTTTQHSR